MQIFAAALEQRFVGGVPDQRVPEAEAVLSGDARDRRFDELTPGEPQ